MSRRMECSYCESEAMYHAYWHKQCPRPCLNACPEHLVRLASDAERNGRDLRSINPRLALEHQSAVIDVYAKTRLVDILRESPYDRT